MISNDHVLHVLSAAAQNSAHLDLASTWLLQVFKYLYLQHEHHGLHSVPLGLPSIHNDGEAPGLALLTARQSGWLRMGWLKGGTLNHNWFLTRVTVVSHVVHTAARQQVSPGNAEQVVQSRAELLHAGLIWAERDGQDETTAAILPPWRHTVRGGTNPTDVTRLVRLSLCSHLTERPASSWGWGGWWLLPCWW